MSPSYHGGPACPSDFPSRTRSKLLSAPPRSFSNFVKQSGMVTSCQSFRLGDQKASSTVTDWMGTGTSLLNGWELDVVMTPGSQQNAANVPLAERIFISRIDYIDQCAK